MAPAAHEAPERHATWLELFFDLVFVASITAVAGVLAKQHGWSGILAALALFLPLWWAWVGHTVYANRFERSDAVLGGDRGHRLLTFLAMGAAAGMAGQLGQVAYTGGAGFAAAYVAARAVLLAQYARERGRPEARPVVDLYLRGFGLGAACWLLSLAVPAPARYGLWALGMAIDLATPWLGRPTLQTMPLHVAHLPERMGLFTLIMLGEGIVVVVSGLGPAPPAAALAVAGAAFAAALAVWWRYFAFIEATHLDCRLGSGQPFIYAHIPVALGLTALAAGVKRAVHEGGHAHLEPETLALLGLGSALWFVGAGLLQAAAGDGLPRAHAVALALATLVAAGVALLGGAAAPPAAVGALALAFVATAAWASPDAAAGTMDVARDATTHDEEVHP